MNNEQYTAAEFIRGVTWTIDIDGACLIGGAAYNIGDMLADIADTSGHNYRNEIFGVLARSARGGDVHAQDLIRRMAETFVYKHCPPEPEPDDIPQPLTLGRSDGAVPGWMTREGVTA